MGSRPEEILERWESLETNCYIQTSHKPACSRTFYFQSSLEIVEHTYENKIHGGLLTAGARGWGWEKREIDVLSFSFLARWLRSAGRRFTKNKRQRLPYRLIQTPKQTNKRLIALLDILKSIIYWMMTPPFRILTLTKLQMFLSSKNRFPAKQHQRSVSWTTLAISIKNWNRPANSIELFTRL